MKFKDLLENPVAQSALKEIMELGFRFSDVPTRESAPYAIIGGRSNARWWFLPLANHSVAKNGLALFQPILTSARILKKAAMTASNMKLTGIWARNRVYISGEPALSNIFKDKKLCCAFFTGTDSPHRKVTVQIMDERGCIKGFAKVTCKDLVRRLLTHEAKTLNYLHSLQLKTALIPEVLFSGKIGNAEVLVTDTRKTSNVKTVTELNNSHIAFLQELSEKSAQRVNYKSDGFVKKLYKQYESLYECLPTDWQRRLKRAIEILAEDEDVFNLKFLSHGDFTSSNTFFIDDKLYVFDWEYSDHDSPKGYDLIHFMLSLPKVRCSSAHNVTFKICGTLQKNGVASDNITAKLLILGYSCKHSLHYSRRQAEIETKPATWEGEPESAALIDYLLSGI